LFSHSRKAAKDNAAETANERTNEKRRGVEGLPVMVLKWWIYFLEENTGIVAWCKMKIRRVVRMKGERISREKLNDEWNSKDVDGCDEWCRVYCWNV
jgi:hypothetical protein